ncbi:MAG: 16S rRNA (cytidine(1402)-2'-O)-methyltransferase [Ruminococcus sp.]|nr:16S rRNA (cytidine(1402)-2'-O)-methyltransferase [Ruminococcus sp.]
MSGTLYIIGTPIGNLEDITLRQLRILGEVDFIAAEDTRVTRKLLSHYKIHTPTMSYHEHSGHTVAQQIVQRILEGQSCGVVTDAGMPCISDPGEPLVQLCQAQGISITVVPGPSAVISALAISGQHTARFTFEGFLSVNRNQRMVHLEQLRQETRTMVFYEAPHKLCRTLRDLEAVFGGEREISLCRELTKLHEEVYRATLSQVVAFYENTPPKGEFVLVVAGCVPEKASEISVDTAVQLVQDRVACGEKLTTACKEIAAQTGISKRELYAQMQSHEKAEN